MSSRTFRVFISSTFADLVEERNALHRNVFPELARICEKAGCRFQAIDLRWGISDEAGLDHRTVEICLQEIARCQITSPRPNFIILLGDRYGWRPLPRQIEASEFEAVERAAEAIGLPALSLLRQWYRLDKNAVPSTYYLRPRAPEAAADYTQTDVWRSLVEIPLRKLLATCLPALSLSEERQLVYKQSLTEREITAGALRPNLADAHEHVFAYFRTIDTLERIEEMSGIVPLDLRQWTDRTPSGSLDVEGRAQLAALKARVRERLGETHCRTYLTHGTYEHLEELCRDVLRDLTGIIEGEISKLTTRDELESEVEAHRQFGSSRGGESRFRGREDLLERIAAYLATDELRRPLVVYGPAGSGKSALLARAAEQARSRSRDAIILQRFVGATPAATDASSLLQSLCAELGVRIGIRSAVPSEYRDLVGEFQERLGRAAAHRPVTIFIDALDQLSNADNAKALTWLPRNLPARAKLVVSVLGNPAEATDRDDPLHVILRWAKPGDLLPIGDFPLKEAATLLMEWLAADQRTLTSVQQSAVLAAFLRCPRPLFLALAAEEAKLWRSEDVPKMPAAASPEAMLGAIIRQMFDRLSEPVNHGPLLVHRALGYLAASRNGLAEGELIELLSTDREFFDAFVEKSRGIGQPLPEGIALLPAAVWVRFYADLQPYLTTRQADGATLITFYHRSLEVAARSQFLDVPSDAAQRHRQLADYFAKQDLFRLTPDELRTWVDKLPSRSRPVNGRKVAELPYHLIEIAKLLGNGDADSPYWHAVTDLLLDIHFLEAVTEAKS